MHARLAPEQEQLCVTGLRVIVRSLEEERYKA